MENYIAAHLYAVADNLHAAEVERKIGEKHHHVHLKVECLLHFDLA